jgi:ferredoxin--NADP+ reductase
MFRVIARESLAPTVTKLVVEAPLVARKRRPGHFVMVRVQEGGGERIPLTIAGSDPEAGTITLIVQAVGKTTKLLSAKAAGESISDVLGPLGHPTPIEKVGAVACVGGGVGTAVVLPIAHALKEVGNQVYSILGARTQELLILENELRACSTELTVVTDDGSYGTKGVVTDPLAAMLDGPLGISVVYAVGPLPMMRAVARLTAQKGVRTIVSLNPIMVDGTGMCGGCRVTVDGKTKFACVDGPEFPAESVDFDELMQRNRTYVDMERVADEHLCRATGEPVQAGRAS